MAGAINFGLIDPNTSLKAANSFTEGQQEAQRNALAKLQLESAQGQNELARYGLAKARREDEIQNALLSALQSGADPYTTYMKSGKAKEAVEIKKAEQESAKTKAETNVKNLELVKHFSGAIAANPTPEYATKTLDYLEQLSGLKLDNDRAQLAQLRSPEEIKQWALSHALKAEERLPKFEKIDANNRIITGTTNPITGAFTQSDVVAKAPEGFVINSDGTMTADPGFLKAKTQIANAGKTSVIVNTEKPLLNTMAEGLGKQLDASLTGANTAVQTIKSARDLVNLVDSGKIISGPLANQRINVAQVAQTLGVGGKDTAELLQNTRLAVQNLALSELNAAASMKGQGQITEAERDILKRAASGDITLTGPELKAIATASEKIATARIQEHQQQVERLKTIPGGQALMPFYSAPAVPAKPQNTVNQPTLIPQGWDVKVK